MTSEQSKYHCHSFVYRHEDRTGKRGTNTVKHETRCKSQRECQGLLHISALISARYSKALRNVLLDLGDRFLCFF